jgi:hypothetical protein
MPSSAVIDKIESELLAVHHEAEGFHYGLLADSHFREAPTRKRGRQTELPPIRAFSTANAAGHVPATSEGAMSR